MAKVTVHQKQVPPPPKTYVLELDEDEAHLVTILTGSVCGGTYGGQFRDVNRRIFMALFDAGCKDRFSSSALAEEFRSNGFRLEGCRNG